ncbi:uL30 family ribosomal protein [Candidatus Micrarchaeota archaeon]|nr:uL30 family ribosomal protein [Candidatus Micrarchaeota archaeon]
MKIAVVRVRGIRKINPKIKKTLELLSLNTPNHCVIIEDTPQNMGMVQVARDYIAYGKISEETLYKLLCKRGEKEGKSAKEIYKDEELKEISRKISEGEDTKKYFNSVFRLHPPRKGHKNIKVHYPKGSLGKWDDMDSLVKRMM